MKRLMPVGMLSAIALAMVSGSLCAAPVVLRASHQFPGGKGDVRDDMVQMIAREAKAANVGLDVQVYPGRVAVQAERPVERDGQRPARHVARSRSTTRAARCGAFSATLMPGLVRSYDRAKRLNDSQFMKDVRAHIEQAGVIVLSDAWFGGGMVSLIDLTGGVK